MCGRLNQFAKMSGLSRAGLLLRIDRPQARSREDRRVTPDIIHNICPTYYADVLTFVSGEILPQRMRSGLVPSIPSLRFGNGALSDCSGDG